MIIEFKHFIGVLLLIFTINVSFGQRVTVSNEISVRSNISYDILPNIGDRVIFYHDQGEKQKFEIYTDNLQYINTVDLEFEKKTILPLGVNSYDDRVHFYYSYRDTGNVHIKVRTYDKTMKCIDTTTLLVRQKTNDEGNPRYAISDDKSQVLIFIPMGKVIYLMQLDNKSHRINYQQLVAAVNVDFKDDFQKLFLSNQGQVAILLHKHSIWALKDDEDHLLLTVMGVEQVYITALRPNSGKYNDIHIGWDNLKQSMVLGAFVYDVQENDIIGYSAINIPIKPIDDILELPVVFFNSEWMASDTGRKVGKVRELNNCELRDIIPRVDGGVVLVTEIVKKFTRRGNNFPSQGNYFDRMNGRGLVDFYHEDVIFFVNNADGSRHWDQLLFKKQFSQDDDGIYSSYFLLKTAGRLKLIYNDEIKNSNTVSEYTIDPLGHYERRSVLSTEYQNLKLRCRDAIQIGPKSFIVPSEKNWRINIVKVDYP
jgi:hypothetical protein